MTNEKLIEELACILDLLFEIADKLTDPQLKAMSETCHLYAETVSMIMYVRAELSENLIKSSRFNSTDTDIILSEIQTIMINKLATSGIARKALEASARYQKNKTPEVISIVAPVAGLN